jgi:hypothetical protein
MSKNMRFLGLDVDAERIDVVVAGSGSEVPFLRGNPLPVGFDCKTDKVPGIAGPPVDLLRGGPIGYERWLDSSWAYVGYRNSRRTRLSRGCGRPQRCMRDRIMRRSGKRDGSVIEV